MVGAVVVRDGEVVGEGWHRRVGGPHAEVEALRAAGEPARGATVYLNLEPCSHHGRTPPCVDALLAAGVARVVACHGDPDPRVRGEGFRRLRRAGVAVEVGEMAEEAVRLNLRYLVPSLLGRPAVTLKWAMTLDGRIATAAGESQWISAPEGRRWGLDLRELHDAVLVGSGTLLADDPRLDRRLGRAEGPIARVVLDRRLRARLPLAMTEASGPVLLYTRSADAVRAGELGEAGVEVIRRERVTPASVLADLHERGIGSVLVEGGAGIHGAFVEAGLFDRVALDLAPMLVGGADAPGPVGGRGVARLDEAPRLEALRLRRRGPDVTLEGLREGCSRDLLQSVAG